LANIGPFASRLESLLGLCASVSWMPGQLLQPARTRLRRPLFSRKLLAELQRFHGAVVVVAQTKLKEMPGR